MIAPAGWLLFGGPRDNAQKFLAVLEAAIDVLVAQRNGWDTKAANAIFSLAMTALGGLVGSAASILMSAGIGITSSFYLDLSQVDMNGNLEALTTLRGLRGVVQSFINDGASTDILTIWVSMKTQKEDTGGTINGEPIMETVTRSYIKASWGGLLRYNHEVSGPLYKKLASTTRASDNPDKQGPK